MKRRASLLLHSTLAIVIALTVGTGSARAVTEKILHNFSAYPHGSEPNGDLVADPSGSFYGTTYYGGTRQLGTVFKLTPNATGAWSESILYSFQGGNDGASPTAGVAFDAAGNLYGTTYSGGASGYGTVFELKPGARGTWTESVIHSFAGGCNDGLYPRSGLVADAAGNLYGTTTEGGCSPGGAGTVFELTPSSGGWAFSFLYSFGADTDGAMPSGRLVFDGAGNLYGTTQFGGVNQGEGTVFELSAKSGGGWTEVVLYRFLGGADGAQPLAGVVLDEAGNLYGTTWFGGNPACPSGCGTIFELATNGNGTWTETLLHRFAGGTDGASPQGSLSFDATGNLFGTTGGEGMYGNGAVFRLARNSNGSWIRTILYSFKGTTDGASQGSVILDSVGNLYGTTTLGGTANAGTVFKLTPSSSGRWKKSLVHAFSSSDAARPYSGVAMDTSGDLYGTSDGGGTYGNGAVFQLSPNSRGDWTRTLLYSFKGTTDGASPGPLTIDDAGNLYGTASAGGSSTCNNGYGCGVVFKLSPNSKGGWTQSVLHTFSGVDGNEPFSGVIFDMAGNLYGTTFYGGSACPSLGCGTVFKLSPSSGGSWTENVLYSFLGYTSDGAYPGVLVIDAAGNLYGLTESGGSGYFGTVFMLAPGSNGQWTESILHNFGPPDGAYPASVVFDAAGNLYGATGQGGNTTCQATLGCGLVFKLAPGSGGQWSETILWSFSASGSDGYSPSSVTFDAAGNFYVETGYGGSTACSGYGCGVLSKFSPGSGGQLTETIVHTFMGAPGDGFSPSAVIADSAGNLYGTAAGGAASEGLVFELIP